MVQTKFMHQVNFNNLLKADRPYPHDYSTRDKHPGLIMSFLCSLVHSAKLSPLILTAADQKFDIDL